MGADQIKTARSGGIDKAQKTLYIGATNKSVKQVVPPEGGDCMSVLEVLTLLNLLAVVIFGILGYIKK